HIGGSAFGSQAHEIVVEDDVEHPVKAVLDAPVRSGGGGELFRRKRGGREVVTSRQRGLALAIDLGLDHADHGESGEAGFAGKAAACREPGDIMRDAAATNFDAAVVAVGGEEDLALFGGLALEE